MAGGRWRRIATRVAGATPLRVQVVALWKLFRDPRTPRLPKLVAMLVLAYALSPIDLIPDAIPVLGMLDELIVVPLGLKLAASLAPRALWLECLAQARAEPPVRLAKWGWGAAIIVAVWLAVGGAFGWWIARRFGWLPA